MAELLTCSTHGYEYRADEECWPCVRDAACPNGERDSSLSPSDSGAYPHIPPPSQSVEPPNLAHDLHILDRFKAEAAMRGLVGEVRNAATLYLALTSRLLDQQVSIGVKGHSSSGKSFTVETVTRFFPPEAYMEMTAMSERALVYSTEQFQHRTLVVYEVVALREGVEDNLTAYFVRSLLSEGRIVYDVTVRGKDGGFVARKIVKEGPTNLVFTTTKTRVHAENETRVLSLNTDDSRAQTAQVMRELADESTNGGDLAEWHQLQAWLAAVEHRVTIPYARTLAEQIPPRAIRLRRDFAAVLALIRAHAILHQLNRARDAAGRVVAVLDDYEAVRELVADVIAEGVGATVPPTVRETVAVVAALAHPDGVKVRVLTDHLKLDQSTISRRVRVAADGGWLHNLEDKRGKPGRWVVGDPMPETADLLPHRRILENVLEQQLCAYAPESEGESNGTTRQCGDCGVDISHQSDGVLCDPCYLRSEEAAS